MSCYDKIKKHGILKSYLIRGSKNLNSEQEAGRGRRVSGYQIYDIWTRSMTFEPAWWHLNHIDDIWTRMMTFEPYWWHSNQIDDIIDIWIRLMIFETDDIWTRLMTFESHISKINQNSEFLPRFPCACLLVGLVGEINSEIEWKHSNTPKYCSVEIMKTGF